MSKLTSSGRKALPDSDFAIPGRRFPIEDKAHAIAAERDVNRAKGLKPGQKATILRKAKAKLGDGDGPDREGAGDRDAPRIFGQLG